MQITSDITTDEPERAESETAQPEAGVWVTGPDGELIPDYESTFPEINEGQVVHGTVVRVDKDEVLVDIGYKSEGVIPTRRALDPAFGQSGGRGRASARRSTRSC